MSKEIERKFLVTDISGMIAMATSHSEIRQAYICDKPESTVRVRTRDSKAYITLKGKGNAISRDEWEYEIPYNDAIEMVDKLCGGFSIEKTRYIVPFNGLNWEVDIFHGFHKGLVLAEIELPDENYSIESFPPFIGKEVSGDPRYYNSNLSRKN